MGDSALRHVDARTAQLFLAHLLTDRGLHQGWPCREERRSLDHDDEVRERRGQGPMARRGSHYDAHGGHHTRQRGQALKIVGPATARPQRVGQAVPRSLEQHHERDALLGCKLSQPVALVAAPGSDGTTHYTEVLGTDQHRAAIDATHPGHQRICGCGGTTRLADTTDQRAQLAERRVIE